MIQNYRIKLIIYFLWVFLYTKREKQNEQVLLISRNIIKEFIAIYFNKFMQLSHK